MHCILLFFKRDCKTLDKKKHNFFFFVRTNITHYATHRACPFVLLLRLLFVRELIVSFHQ